MEENERTQRSHAATSIESCAQSSCCSSNSIRPASILQLRREGLLSVGASQELHTLLKRKYNYRRPNGDELVRQSYIILLYQDLLWILRELNYSVAPDEVEIWALFVHERLTRNRFPKKYHTVAHVYQISAGASPLQFLATMVRDIVCCITDDLGSPSLLQHELLKGVLLTDTSILHPIQSNVRVELVAFVFGFKPGDSLIPVQSRFAEDMRSLFLSAICAIRLLHGHLSRQHIAQLSAILAATNPFRSDDDDDDLNQLHDRLSSCNDRYRLELTKDELTTTIQQGVDLRNRFFGNLITDDITDFLDLVWRLIPGESHPRRDANMFSLVDCYSAISLVTELVHDMQHDTVYRSFGGVPTLADLKRMTSKLIHNRSQIRVYLHARLLAVALVGAFACLTGGGEAPMSFFFGDLPSFEYVPERLGDDLVVDGASPPHALSESSDVNSQVYAILQGIDKARYDDELCGLGTRSDPFAAFLYQHLGDTGLNDVMVYCSAAVITNPLLAWNLLEALPSDLVVTAGKSFQLIVVSRRVRIQQLCLEVQQRVTGKSKSLHFL